VVDASGGSVRTLEFNVRAFAQADGQVYFPAAHPSLSHLKV
jgi:hypothetical protein